MVIREWGEFAYAPPSTVREDFIALDEAEAHHLYRVRRVGVGDAVFATDGNGTVYRCDVTPDRSLQIKERLAEYGEPTIHLMLCMAALKGDSNREVVDLATQLGARAIHFFQAERSEGRLQADRLDKLTRVAITAIKQCGRARLPEIKLYPNLKQLLEALPTNTSVFMPHTQERRLDLSVRLLTNDQVALLVGPEGGFTDQELELVTSGARFLHLGGRRLRAETAVAAGLSYLLNCAGEIGSE